MHELKDGTVYRHITREDIDVDTLKFEKFENFELLLSALPPFHTYGSAQHVITYQHPSEGTSRVKISDDESLQTAMILLRQRSSFVIRPFTINVKPPVKVCSFLLLIEIC
jgi:hypothetical protein